jgi:hypothetical protein
MEDIEKQDHLPIVAMMDFIADVAIEQEVWEFLFSSELMTGISWCGSSNSFYDYKTRFWYSSSGKSIIWRIWNYESEHRNNILGQKSARNISMAFIRLW